MSQDRAASPFSALSYQEQQDRWLEWRSRQLDYQPVREDQAAPAHPAPQERAAPSLPPLRVPNMPIAAPAQHKELDHVLSRHREAARRAGAFQPAAKS